MSMEKQRRKSEKETLPRSKTCEVLSLPMGSLTMRGERHRTVHIPSESFLAMTPPI